MEEIKYYDGGKLLSMKDINGEKPEIFMVTTNRTGGKTTWFNRFVVSKFLKTGSKFMLIYRFNYELGDVDKKFYKDIGSLFFQGHIFESVRRARGMYYELFLDGKSCGYAVSLNSADKVKTYSHLFSDVDRMIFDEFQSETDSYCDEEIRKFRSIHNSVARGQGKMNRYVPVYMISNPVSLLNPYYCVFHIAERIQYNTKFLKGDGWVLEQGFVQAAADAYKQSGFNRAFGDDHYAAYASQAIYLNDNHTFIENIKGQHKYLATIKFGGEYFSIKEFGEQGIIYCDSSYDATFPRKIAVTTEDHQVNHIMMHAHDTFFMYLRYHFDRGHFRFKNGKCKQVIMNCLAYK